MHGNCSSALDKLSHLVDDMPKSVLMAFEKHHDFELTFTNIIITNKNATCATCVHVDRCISREIGGAATARLRPLLLGLTVRDTKLQLKTALILSAKRQQD